MEDASLTDIARGLEPPIRKHADDLEQGRIPPPLVDALYDADPTWLFARVPEPKTAKNRVHLDVIAADPEGNEFDLAQAL